MKQSKKMLYGYTDYPIVELGDTEGEKAPVRSCRAFRYDGNKYLKIEVCKVFTEIKSGYFYKNECRYGDGHKNFSYRELTCIEN